MSNKLYDCVIIASDKQGTNKVRFANNLSERVKILQRDNFTIHYALKFDNKMNKRELLDKVDYNNLNEDLQEVVDSAYEVLKRSNEKKTSVSDVFAAILARKNDTTNDEVVL